MEGINMFEKMAEKEKWEIINRIIDETKTGETFNIYLDKDCPECGNIEHIFVMGYRCSGSLCIHCGNEDISNDYY